MRICFLILVWGVGFYVQADEPVKTALFLGGTEVPQFPANYGELVSAVNEKLTAAHYNSIVAFGASTSGEEFSLENARSKIAQAARAIQNGKPGDQVLVVIETHGAPPSWGGLHVVLTTDGKKLDLAELKALQDLAREKHVRLAVMDLTCYSGQALKLAERDPDTCVITGSSATMVAVADFGEALFKNIQPGKSLEQAFLEARRELQYGFPQISTPGNLSASSSLELVQKMATPYEADLKNSVDVPADGGCDTKFISQLKAMTDILRAAIGIPWGDIYQLKKDLVRYQKRGQEILSPFSNSEVTVGDATVSMAELANIETVDFYIQFYGNMSNRAVAIHKDLEQLTAKRDTLMETDPQFRALVERTRQLAKKPEEIYSIARDVGIDERKIYDKLYSRTPSMGKNACADFKF